MLVSMVGSERPVEAGSFTRVAGHTVTRLINFNEQGVSITIHPQSAHVLDVS